MSAAILTDLTLCIGCGACVNACREVNGLPAEGAKDQLTPTSWTAVQTRDSVHIRHQCMHCLEPTCASVCPVAALEKTPDGAVVYHEDRCIGCRYCIMACPFEIPTYEWDKPDPRVRKCTLCHEHRMNGASEPACTSVCPTRATIFGDRKGLVTEAQRRIRENPERYVDHIYGLEEAGGTSVLYLSDVPFELLGFPHTLTGVSYPTLTWNVLSQIPTIASVGGVLMAGIWWITRRRMTMEREHLAHHGGER